MAFDREAAKQAGYTDEEINSFITANPHVETAQDKNQTEAARLPSPDEVVTNSAGQPYSDNPSDSLDRSNETGMTAAMGVGMGAAGVGLPYAAYRVGKAVLSPAAQGVRQFAQQGMDLGNRAAGAMEGRTAIDAARESRMASGGAYGRPVVPTAVPPAAPVTAPIAPVTQTAEQGLANRIKQTAAQRITGLIPSMSEALGTAGRMAGRVVGGVGPALMAYSGDTGPQVPQVGRMRGSEINPMSGKPWTPTEIQAYSANPSMYDQAYLQRPQLPR
tara:strand:- start:370 stop:1191 length:822 start_codon:yes stop_codon:yes gene_type:complete